MRRIRMRVTRLRASGALHKYSILFLIFCFIIFFFNIGIRFLLPVFHVDPSEICDALIGGLSVLIAEIAPEFENLIYLDTDSSITILKKGIPFLGTRGGGERLEGKEGLLERLISMLTGVEFSHPRAIIRAEIPYILSSRETTVVLSRSQLFTREGPSEKSSSDPTHLLPPEGPSLPGGRVTENELDEMILKRDSGGKMGWGKEPLIAIYHTHTSESYEAMSGVTHTQGTVGDIVKVGDELTRRLREKYGIPVIHDRTINDFPRWSQAYVNALTSISSIIRLNPSLKMVLDLHRDGFERDRVSPTVAKETVTGVVTGRNVARILIVVTTDEYGLPHPNWQKNYNFARLLNEVMNQMYPGLSRGIRIRNDGRFNQHVHEHALLLEIGSYESLEDEVMLSARMLGDVLAVVLEKMR